MRSTKPFGIESLRLQNYSLTTEPIRNPSPLIKEDPKLMKFMLDHGADYVTGSPIASALSTGNKAVIGLYRTYLPKYPNLKRQADIALLESSKEGKLRATCLLLWAGANPRAKVPEIGDEDAESEYFWTALTFSVFRGHLEIVKKIKPDPSLDDMDDLLESASYSKNLELIKYLIEKGAKLNDSQGHSKTFERALWGLERAHDSHFGSESVVWQNLKFVESLIELGAKWNPSERDSNRAIRACLSKLDSHRALHLIHLLKKSASCSDELLAHIVNTPKIKERLSEHADKLVKILPCFSRWAKRQKLKVSAQPVSYATTTVRSGTGKPWGSWKWYNRNRT
jgi:hypothetical protein